MSDALLHNWKPAEEREAKQSRSRRQRSPEGETKVSRRAAKKAPPRGASRAQESTPRKDYRPLLIRMSLLVLIIGVAIGGYAWLQHQQWENFTVRTIEITGSHEYVGSEEVSAALQQYAQGDFFNMEIEAAREALLALPWVREVSLRREWPDRLVIKLREQQAVARWGVPGVANGELSALLNEQAQNFNGLHDVEGQSLPALFGPEGYEARVLAEYAELSQALSALDVSVRRLQLDARDTWRMTLNTGLEALFLQRNRDDALHRLKTALSLSEGLGLQNAKKIDLRYSNGFAIEWSNDVDVGLNHTQERKSDV